MIYLHLDKLYKSWKQSLKGNKIFVEYKLKYAEKKGGEKLRKKQEKCKPTHRQRDIKRDTHKEEKCQLKRV